MNAPTLIRDPNRRTPLANLRQSVRIRMKRQASDLAHDFSHIQRVWRNAEAIATESAVNLGWKIDLDVLEAAVLLHEIGRGAEANSEWHTDASARLAEELLRAEGLAELVWPVGEVIVCNSSFRVANSPEAKVLRDADALEELGAVGVARVFLLGATQAVPALYDTEDPAGKARELDETAFLLDRFPLRLFRVIDNMQTESGRREADKRTRILRAYYTALLKESGVDPG